ncbi:MAG: hypothetical protein AB2N28_3230 [Candidatus Phytoplasma solani]
MFLTVILRKCYNWRYFEVFEKTQNKSGQFIK